jgi:hypothetical protein
MIQAMDRLLYSAVTRGWPHPRIENYIGVLKVDDAGSALPNVVSRTFQIIDTKASGLLTHTSMMIAALGVAGHLVADSYLENGVIVIEIMLYLLVAIACLRCMAIFNEHSIAHDPSMVSNAVRDELILRRELYMVCNRATIALTVLIFFSLPILYLYTPAR